MTITRSGAEESCLLVGVAASVWEGAKSRQQLRVHAAYSLLAQRHCCFALIELHVSVQTLTAGAPCPTRHRRPYACFWDHTLLQSDAQGA